jgi:translation initiation factor eIF-2B subunit delta
MSSKKSDGKPNLTEKTREEIKAEREAKKAAKAAAKLAKNKINKTSEADNSINNVTAIANNEIPETSNCAIKANKTKEKSSIIKNVNNEIKNKSLEISNKISEQIVKIDSTDITNTKDKKTAEKIAKQDVMPSSNVSEPSENGNERKSKAELRAERRAKQEAQRAVKQQQLLAKSNDKPQTVKQTAKPIEIVSECSVKKIITKSAINEDAHEINLFKHLYYERQLSSVNISTINSKIHPVIVKLGVQYANKIIVGSNARCIALLAAVKQVIEEFEKPVQADFVRGLETTLQESLAYLHHCRPLAVSMQNAMRHLKWHMAQFSSTLADDKVRYLVLIY